MPLPTFKTKAEIPAGFEDIYEEKDGQWSPKPADDGGLKSALDEERTKREAAEKLAKKAADELRKTENRLKAEAAGLTQEQQEKMRADLKAELDAEYAPLKDAAAERERLAAENRTLKLDNTVQSLLGTAGFLAEKIEKVWTLEKGAFDLTADGKPMVKDKPGVDVSKYIADTIVKAYPEWVRGTQASGGGAKGGTGTTPQSGSQTAGDAVIANPLAVLRAANEAQAA